MLGLLIASTALLSAITPNAAVATAPSGVSPPWPVTGGVVAEFDPPEPDWLPGHRGIDLSAAPGTVVRTPRAGTVSFTGRVAGTPVVVVDHGSVRATYQPVGDAPALGSPVGVGDTLGVVKEGPAHCTPTCLHWGARVGERYVDPRVLLGQVQVVLLPTAD